MNAIECSISEVFMAKKKKTVEGIYFEYSPLEITDIETAYELVSPFLKENYKVTVRRDQIRNEWSFRVLPLHGIIGHLEYSSYIVQVKPDGRLLIISVGNFN